MSHYGQHYSCACCDAAARRASLDGRAVPVYRPLVGESVDGCAQRLGLWVPPRSERRTLDPAKIVAMIESPEDGLHFPAVARG